MSALRVNPWAISLALVFIFVVVVLSQAHWECSELPVPEHEIIDVPLYFQLHLRITTTWTSSVTLLSFQVFPFTLASLPVTILTVSNPQRQPFALLSFLVLCVNVCTCLYARACVDAGPHVCGRQTLMSGVFLDPSPPCICRIFHCNTGFGDSARPASQFAPRILSLSPKCWGCRHDTSS